MSLRITLFINLTFFILTACATSRPVAPDLTQQILFDTWHTDRHVIWELHWPATPIIGPLTVESWHAGDRYRFEILETTAPALIGQTVAFDGKNAWRYNRFNPPAGFSPTTAVLSPVSDLFSLIDIRLSTSPQTATQESAQINFSPAQKITAIYPNGDSLTLWQDIETGLPVRIEFSFDRQQITLKARHAEPLIDPPDELFGVGDWVY